MWTADELAGMRADLLAQLRELDHVGADGGGPGYPTPGDDAAGPDADDSTEAEELAARSAEADVTFRVTAVESHLRGEVADALARLDHGRYGVRKLRQADHDGAVAGPPTRLLVHAVRTRGQVGRLTVAEGGPHSGGG